MFGVESEESLRSRSVLAKAPADGSSNILTSSVAYVLEGDSSAHRNGGRSISTARDRLVCLVSFFCTLVAEFYPDISSKRSYEYGPNNTTCCSCRYVGDFCQKVGGKAGVTEADPATKRRYAVQIEKISVERQPKKLMKLFSSYYQCLNCWESMVTKVPPVETTFSRILKIHANRDSDSEIVLEINLKWLLDLVKTLGNRFYPKKKGKRRRKKTKVSIDLRSLNAQKKSSLNLKFPMTTVTINKLFVKISEAAGFLAHMHSPKSHYGDFSTLSTCFLNQCNISARTQLQQFQVWFQDLTGAKSSSVIGWFSLKAICTLASQTSKWDQGVQAVQSFRKFGMHPSQTLSDYYAEYATHKSEAERLAHTAIPTKLSALFFIGGMDPDVFVKFYELIRNKHSGNELEWSAIVAIVTEIGSCTGKRLGGSAKQQQRAISVLAEYVDDRLTALQADDRQTRTAQTKEIDQSRKDQSLGGGSQHRNTGTGLRTSSGIICNKCGLSGHPWYICPHVAGRLRKLSNPTDGFYSTGGDWVGLEIIDKVACKKALGVTDVSQLYCRDLSNKDSMYFNQDGFWETPRGRHHHAMDVWLAGGKKGKKPERVMVSRSQSINVLSEDQISALAAPSDDSTKSRKRAKKVKNKKGNKASASQKRNRNNKRKRSGSEGVADRIDALFGDNVADDGLTGLIALSDSSNRMDHKATLQSNRILMEFSSGIHSLINGRTKAHKQINEFRTSSMDEWKSRKLPRDDPRSDVGKVLHALDKDLIQAEKSQATRDDYGCDCKHHINHGCSIGFAILNDCGAFGPKGRRLQASGESNRYFDEKSELFNNHKSAHVEVKSPPFDFAGWSKERTERSSPVHSTMQWDKTFTNECKSEVPPSRRRTCIGCSIASEFDVSPQEQSYHRGPTPNCLVEYQRFGEMLRRIIERGANVPRTDTAEDLRHFGTPWLFYPSKQTLVDKKSLEKVVTPSTAMRAIFKNRPDRFLIPAGAKVQPNGSIKSTEASWRSSNRMLVQEHIHKQNWNGRPNTTEPMREEDTLPNNTRLPSDEEIILSTMDIQVLRAKYSCKHVLQGFVTNKSPFDNSGWHLSSAQFAKAYGMKKLPTCVVQLTRRFLCGESPPRQNPMIMNRRQMNSENKLRLVVDQRARSVSKQTRKLQNSFPLKCDNCNLRAVSVDGSTGQRIRVNPTRLANTPVRIILEHNDTQFVVGQVHSTQVIELRPEAISTSVAARCPAVSLTDSNRGGEFVNPDVTIKPYDGETTHGRHGRYPHSPGMNASSKPIHPTRQSPNVKPIFDVQMSGGVGSGLNEASVDGGPTVVERMYRKNAARVGVLHPQASCTQCSASHHPILQFFGTEFAGCSEYRVAISKQIDTARTIQTNIASPTNRTTKLISFEEYRTMEILKEKLRYFTNGDRWYGPNCAFEQSIKEFFMIHNPQVRDSWRTDMVRAMGSRNKMESLHMQLHPTNDPWSFHSTQLCDVNEFQRAQSSLITQNGVLHLPMQVRDFNRATLYGREPGAGYARNGERLEINLKRVPSSMVFPTQGPAWDSKHSYGWHLRGQHRELTDNNVCSHRDTHPPSLFPEDDLEHDANTDMDMANVHIMQEEIARKFACNDQPTKGLVDLNHCLLFPPASMYEKLLVAMFGHRDPNEDEEQIPEDEGFRKVMERTPTPGAVDKRWRTSNLDGRTAWQEPWKFMLPMMNQSMYEIEHEYSSGSETDTPFCSANCEDQYSSRPRTARPARPAQPELPAEEKRVTWNPHVHAFNNWEALISNPDADVTTDRTCASRYAAERSDKGTSAWQLSHKNQHTSCGECGNSCPTPGKKQCRDTLPSTPKTQLPIDVRNHFSHTERQEIAIQLDAEHARQDSTDGRNPPVIARKGTTVESHRSLSIIIPLDMAIVDMGNFLQIDETNDTGAGLNYMILAIATAIKARCAESIISMGRYKTPRTTTAANHGGIQRIGYMKIRTYCKNVQGNLTEFITRYEIIDTCILSVIRGVGEQARQDGRMRLTALSSDPKINPNPPKEHYQISHPHDDSFVVHRQINHVDVVQHDGP